MTAGGENFRRLVHWKFIFPKEIGEFKGQMLPTIPMRVLEWVGELSECLVVLKTGQVGDLISEWAT